MSVLHKNVLRSLLTVQQLRHQNYTFQTGATNHPMALHNTKLFYCRARQCLPLRRKFMEWLYKQSSSDAFDETSSYWSAPKNF